MHTHDLIAGTVDAVHSTTIDAPDHALARSELAVLARYRDDLVSKHVLDIGCGDARLVPYLLDLTPSYLGIDISPPELASCRAQYPAGRFALADMRSLEAFYGTIDTAIATGNLLDVLSHEDRIHVLTELHRVLVPGGLLVFSSHNRLWTESGARPHLEHADRALDKLRCVGEFVVASVNHMLHYYVDRETQASQLAEAGFTLLETLDIHGEPLVAGAGEGDSPSLLYVARR
jgi:SAM-dependent methyltransferase